MRLSPRLKAVASMVPKGSIVADIGTDHGYIPVSLIRGGIIQRALATDIRKGPLERARRVIKHHNLEDNIEILLGDGLEVLKGKDVDVVVLAGMGGVLVQNILEAGEGLDLDIKRLVLQPMNAQNKVREWLFASGYKIIDETLAQEKDKLYEIITAVPGKEFIHDTFYFEIGKRLIEKNHPLLPALIKKKEQKYKRIITGLKNSKQARATEKIEEYTVRLARLRGVKNQCRS